MRMSLNRVVIFKLRFWLCLISSALVATTVAANSSLPRLANPLENLAVPIPGLDIKPARYTDTAVESNWIADYILAIYRFGLAIIAVIAITVIAIAGLMWVLSAGNPGKIGRAQNLIKDALLGLALALLSFLFLALINRDLVVFKSLNLSTVDKEEIPNFTSGGGSFLNLSDLPPNRPTFSNNVDDYDQWLRQYANDFDVDCTLAKAHMMAESGGQADAVSWAGAVGLMQLMPATAQNLGVTNRQDPEQSIRGGVKYIAQLSRTCCNGQASNSVCNCADIRFRIAAYNAGPGGNQPSHRCLGQTQWQCQQNNGYAETRLYVERVLANYNYLINQGWGC